MTAIRAIGTYLPERTLGNDELIERFDWDREFLEDKLGIHQRHIAAEGEGGQADLRGGSRCALRNTTSLMTHMYSYFLVLVTCE